MNCRKYIFLSLIFLVGISMSCRDESLYPLPYNDKTSGAYLRMYKITSNIFDLNNLGASGFEVIYEAVDEEYGENLQEVEFYVSHRRGLALTSEVLIKKIPGTDFSSVPEPTYSEYKRATIKITANETLAALTTATGFPGSLAAADQVIYRWVMVLKDGRRFTVANPQGTNSTEANNTANITSGVFYSAPSIYTITVRAQLGGSWVGTYSLTQSAIWSPAHSWDFHINYPEYMKSILFPNQTVTLSIPTNGLSTEREFTVQYRGQNVIMRINLENGVVFVPQQNSTVNCTEERQLYWCTPATGNFTKAGTSTVNLVYPLPTATTANRGNYTAAQTGLVTGQVLTIGVDDDCDEYGRRNGYCTWTRRVRLTLTKL